MKKILFALFLALSLGRAGAAFAEEMKNPTPPTHDDDSRCYSKYVCDENGKNCHAEKVCS